MKVQLELNQGFGAWNKVTALVALMACLVISVAEARSQAATQLYWQSAYQVYNNLGRAQTQVDRWANALKEYYALYKKLPSSISEMDKFLMENYETCTGLLVPSDLVVQPKQQLRTLPGVAIWVDPQVTTIPVVNNQWKFPQSWQSAENIGIVIDGDKNFVVFWANPDGSISTIYRVGRLN